MSLSRIAGPLQVGLGWRQVWIRPAGDHPGLGAGGAARVSPTRGTISKATPLFQPKQQMSHTYLSSQHGTCLGRVDGQG